MGDEPPSIPSTLAAVWELQVDAGTRGPRPALSIDRIVKAGVAVADEHAEGGPSLTRVAERLGVSTPGLYRYLESRAELDVLVSDEALGPPPTLSGDLSWRDAVTTWVLALRARHHAHPWLIDVQTHVPMLPNVLGWLDCLLHVLVDAGLSLREAVRAATAIDAYVRATVARDRATTQASPGNGQQVWFTPEAVGVISAEARARNLVYVADVMDGSVFEDEAASDDDGFMHGLDLLLRGVADLLNS